MPRHFHTNSKTSISFGRRKRIFTFSVPNGFYFKLWNDLSFIANVVRSPMTPLFTIWSCVIGPPWHLFCLYKYMFYRLALLFVVALQFPYLQILNRHQYQVSLWLCSGFSLYNRCLSCLAIATAAAYSGTLLELDFLPGQ